MNRVHGIGVTVSSHEHGLWYDSDAKEYNSKGWGVKCELVVGKLLRPIGRFWLPSYWKDGGLDPWSSGKHAFVLRLPVFIGPFVSISLGPYGLYIGLKSYHMTAHHWSRYQAWAKRSEVPQDGSEWWYLCPSLTIRKTRWK